MPLLLPARSNDYQVTRDTPLDVNVWLATVCDIATRLNQLEAQRTDLQQIIDTGTSQAIAVVNENLGPLIAQINLQIEDLNNQLAAALQSAAAAQSAAEDAQEFATSILNSGEVTASPQITLKAFGSIAKGQVVGLRSDGKAAGLKVGEIPYVSSTTTTGTNYFSAATDGAGTHLIVYRDGGNSNYGTAIVATVSGTEITWGTAVVFNAATTNYNSVAYDSAAGKFVIVFSDGGNSNYGTAIVATVSGTSVSFGTKAVFKSATSNYTTASYDSNAGKHLIAFSDGGNSNKLAAVAGTVSGTSITFGTVAILSSSGSASQVSVCYHSSAKKTVAAYYDATSKGTSVVASISGTSVSFGTAVVFDATAVSANMLTSYDSVNDKVAVFYRPSSGYAAVVGTVSGTSITFGAPVPSSTVFYSVGYNIGGGYFVLGNQIESFTVSGTTGAFGEAHGPITGVGSIDALTYDGGTLIYFYVASNKIGGRVLSAPGAPATSTRIGIAKADAEDGDNINVTVGGGKSGDQSGLTTGAIYYIDDTGTLITSIVPGSKVGRALSATELLVELAA